MSLILDSSVIIDLDKKEKGIVKSLAALKAVHPSPAKISFMTYFEFIHGLREKQPQNKEKALLFINSFDVLQTTKVTASILSLLKQQYGDLELADLFIAAQAIENNLMLVTKDKDFERIKELNKIIL